MSIYYQDDKVTLHHGDCLDVLATLPDASVDAVVTDPPYGLANTDPAHVAETITRWVNGERDYLPGGRGFMGKAWDAFVPPAAVWDECLRVLKPGGHVLTFAGSRTVDLMTMGLRLAGFDIRDSLAWLYGSGFPKSMDVSKAIDKAGGNPLAFREFARAYAAAVASSELTHSDIDRTLGIKSSSCYWAREDQRGGMPPRHHWEIVRDLLDLGDEFVRIYDAAEREVIGSRTVNGAEGSAGGYANGIASQRGLGGIVREIDVTAPATPDAERWQGWGTAMKPAFEPIVMARKPLVGTVAANVLEHGTGALNIDACRVGSSDNLVRPAVARHDNEVFGKGLGSGVQENPAGRWPANVILDESQAAVLDEQSGTLTSGSRKAGTHGLMGYMGADAAPMPEVVGDSGGASRFFYVAKAPKSERPVVDGVAHPTVKPVSLMQWLVRLVTPPGGTVLEPFAGSGTTVEAATREGFACIAVEREADYLPLIRARIDREHARQAAEDANRTPSLFDEAAS